jgi:hypothetical protein
LLRLLALIKRFDEAKAIGQFEVRYSFPSFFDKLSDGPMDDEMTSQRLSFCYEKGKYCSVGLLDGRLD